MKVRSHVIAMIWCLCAGWASAQGGFPQPSDRYVNDYAGVLSGVETADIRARFSDLRTSHGIQAVVVTIRSTRDYSAGRGDFDSFARGLFDAWGIGDPTRNDGALLLVGMDDHKTRIELGAGYGHRLDARMHAIVDGDLLPEFRVHRFGPGIVKAAQSLSTTLMNERARQGSTAGGGGCFRDRFRPNARDAGGSATHCGVGSIEPIGRGVRSGSRSDSSPSRRTHFAFAGNRVSHLGRQDFPRGRADSDSGLDPLRRSRTRRQHYDRAPPWQEEVFILPGGNASARRSLRRRLSRLRPTIGGETGLDRLRRI